MTNFNQSSPVIFDETVRAAIQGGAIVVYSLSGGKDSGVAGHATDEALDLLGHPKADRYGIHADLGRVEWKRSAGISRELCEQLGIEYIEVRRAAGDMIHRWETRFERGKARYENLEIFNLIGPWSSASLRFCTAEMKQQVISPALQKRFPGRTIISVVGIRREESANRSKTPVSKWEDRWAQRNGTRLLTWNPIVEMTTDEVFAYHEAHGVALHEGYTKYGSTRISCAYCIMGSLRDLKASTSCADNRPVYIHQVEMEAKSTFSFQPDRWLADVSPELLSPGLARDVEAGKLKAAERRDLEAAMPEGLRYVKGWPPRLPTMDEAGQVARAREIILGHHGLENRFPTAQSIVTRFQDLMDQEAAKQARKVAA